MFGATEIGSVRKENQDAVVACGSIAYESGAFLEYIVRSGKPVVVGVIDGMGGYLGGNEAAGIAALRLACVQGAQGEPEWTEWSVGVSKRIRAFGETVGMPGMGAVFATLVLTKDGAQCVNVGDCRVYRQVEDHFLQVSVDDRTQVPGSSALTQALGISGDDIAPHVKMLPYAADKERYLLCSDGVHGTLDNEELYAQIAREEEVAVIGRELIDIVYRKEPQDNFSFVTVEVDATEAEVWA